MFDDDFEFFSREELLEGPPTKRAKTLLFAIENRTAHLAAQSRQTMERFLTAEAAEERELAFLEALALEREASLRPSIQHLEHHALQWASLVPQDNPRMRAAIAHQMGQKYEFTVQVAPGIRAALGLDAEPVRQAYQRMYHEPLETIFATRLRPVDWLRWSWARLGHWLENLSPFWTAFALTLTETVGGGILALPIALASVGPLAGVMLLIVFGLINVVTIAFMAEAITRSGTIRYSSAFIGRAVADYLGWPGAFVLTGGLYAICAIVLLAFYIGFSTTMADISSIPAAVWMALLFLVGLYFVRRESLDATVASALVIGIINIALILILSLLAFTQVQPANLLYVNVPFLSGRPFDPSILQLVFGVVLVAYFGHLSVSNCANVVLRRDPSGRSLIWGVMTAQVAAIVLYCIFVIAVNGAIAPQVLAKESGTALIPLAAEVGPIVYVFGTIFIVLGMGMITIHFSLGLFNLTREWLPAKPKTIVKLPRRRGQLLLRSNRSGSGSELRLGLTYLGLVDDRPEFRLQVQLDGTTRHIETAISGNWEATAPFDQLLPEGLRQRDFRLALEVQEASQESVLLRVDSSLNLTYQGEWETAGLSLADLLDLADDQQQLVNWLLRQEMMGKDAVSLAGVAAHTGQTEVATRSRLKVLVEQGFIRELIVDGETCYQPRLSFKRGRGLTEDIWQALTDEPKDTKEQTEGVSKSYFLSALLSERGRFFLALSPMVLVFLLTEWLVLTGAESFTEPLNFLGVIVASLLAGIFPVLLLAASRQKGEIIPGVVYRILGHPVLLIGIYLLSLAGLFLHGLVIWADPVQRVVAIAVGLLMLGVTVAMVRQGAFARRIVVELRDNQAEGGQAGFALTVGGQPTPVEVRLGYRDDETQLQAASGDIPAFDSLRNVNFQLPIIQARGLKVWAHKITPEGNSESLPALLTVHGASEKQEFDLKLSDGQVVLPLSDETRQVDISLTEHE